MLPDTAFISIACETPTNNPVEFNFIRTWLFVHELLMQDGPDYVKNLGLNMVVSALVNGEQK